MNNIDKFVYLHKNRNTVVEFEQFFFFYNQYKWKTNSTSPKHHITLISTVCSKKKEIPHFQYVIALSRLLFPKENSIKASPQRLIMKTKQSNLVLHYLKTFYKLKKKELMESMMDQFFS